MRDLLINLEKLQVEAAEFRLISELATDKAKRELFARLAQHLSVLACEIEREILARVGRPGIGVPV